MLKKIEEFDLERCIYMSFGPHQNETPEDIYRRKMKEIEDCQWSLWAYRKSCVKIRDFCETGVKYVVMPITGKNTKGTTKVASKYFIDGIEKIIPQGINVTYSGNRCDALVVEKYHLIDKNHSTFTKSDYVVPSGFKKFNGLWPLEKNNEKKGTNKLREYNICIIAELKTPYSVIVE